MRFHLVIRVIYTVLSYFNKWIFPITVFNEILPKITCSKVLETCKISQNLQTPVDISLHFQKI